MSTKEVGGLWPSDLGELLYSRAIAHDLYFSKSASPNQLAWIQIEDFCLGSKHIKEIIWQDKASRLIATEMNPFLHLTLRIWDRYRAKVVHSPSQAAVFLGQPWFPAAYPIHTFKAWRMGNIWRLSDIMSKGKLLTKVQLEQKFGVQIPWYEYQQVHSMFSNRFSNQFYEIEPSEFESLLIKDSYLNRGIISLLYRSLCGSIWAVLPKFQWSWVKDCQCCINPETWSSIWKSSLVLSKSQFVRLQQLKLVTRWYITPLKASYFVKNGSTLCWKGCGGVGTFFHCWWECPKIQVFWKSVHHQICKIMSLQFPFTPELILLDYWYGVHITGYSRELISLLLLAAKCVWAKVWKQSKVPSVKVWMMKVWDIMIANKVSESLLAAQIPLYSLQFLERWFHFLGFIAKNKYVSTWCPQKLRCIALY